MCVRRHQRQSQQPDGKHAAPRPLKRDSFALGSDNDLDVNPFLWAVERLHGHQCIRWLSQLVTPSTQDLRYLSRLRNLLSYRLDDADAVVYANERRLRGDFGLPGAWPPLQTTAFIEGLDHDAGFLWHV